MDWFPDEPRVDEAHRASGPSHLRYEDLCQDGRVTMLALPFVLGEVVWRQQLAIDPVALWAETRGIVPVLTRLVVEGGAGRIAPASATLLGTSSHQLAHTLDELGEPDRLLLNMWVDVRGTAGNPYGPPSPEAGATVAAGRVFAEHVLTRIFAPRAERKVLRLDVPGHPAVPPTRWTWRPPEDLLEPPAGALLLDETPVADPVEVAFGLDHSDGNQHVNSLVYPRLFLDAALRRLAAHGLPTRVLARRLEVAYRKPCFAGDRARLVMRAFTCGERVGVAGAFVPVADPSARPACTLQVSFAP